MKPCPYCRQELENDAAQCPYCERWLDPALDRTLNADSAPILLPPRALSGLAIASLVCGIFWVLGMGSVAALILGYLALRQIRRDPLRVGGRRMAIAGVVLGCVGIAGTVLVLFLGYEIWKTKREYYATPVHRQARVHVIQSAAGAGIASTTGAADSMRFSPVVISQQDVSSSKRLTS
jgi:hypothetical protein